MVNPRLRSFIQSNEYRELLTLLKNVNDEGVLDDFLAKAETYWRLGLRVCGVEAAVVLLDILLLVACMLNLAGWTSTFSSWPWRSSRVVVVVSWLL